jgi:hypothetical protein
MAALHASPAAAQTGRTAVFGLRAGDIVWVTSAGHTTKGRVWSVSPDAIVIAAGQQMTFKRADIQKIDRQVPDSSRDGLGKGAAIGAVAGAVTALISEAGSSTPVNNGNFWSEAFGDPPGGLAGAVAAGAIVGAILGMPTGFVIDRFHHGRESIPLASLGSTRLGLRPIVSPTRVGSQFTIRW